LVRFRSQPLVVGPVPEFALGLLQVVVHVAHATSLQCALQVAAVPQTRPFSGTVRPGRPGWRSRRSQCPATLVRFHPGAA
jgi:hypothetical protein